MRTEYADVVIVGAGPAGLAAAAELRSHGSWRVTVLDRESTAGGIPRHTRHTGYGVRDMHRIMSGPAYARRYETLARAAGADIRTGTAVTGWASRGALATTSPDGLAGWHARAVLLATGCRERPRTARLVPGDRPAGVFTTGALQQFADLYQLPVGRRAVVVGAEHVSFSAVHTLAAHGVRVAAVVTGHPKPQSYPLLQAITAGLHRVPVFTSTEMTAITGKARVESVTLRDRHTGRIWVIGCDTVVFTGDWIPDNELARIRGIRVDRGTRGPCVDQLARTCEPGVFAAGNLVHAAETADIAALSGRLAARAITRYLHAPAWPDDWIPIHRGEGLRWIYPTHLAAGDGPPPRGRLITRTQEFCGRGHFEVTQEGRLLHREPKHRLVPNRSITITAGWLNRIRPAGGPITVNWVNASR